jgi:hypothetical protein
MENILKKFYSAGVSYEDPNSKLYENFMTAVPPRKEIPPIRNEEMWKQPFIQNDETFFKMPVNDDVFNIKPEVGKPYPSLDKLMYSPPKVDPGKVDKKGDFMKIQMIEQKIQQMERKHDDEKLYLLERIRDMEERERRQMQGTPRRGMNDMGYINGTYMKKGSEEAMIGAPERKLDGLSGLLLGFKDDLIDRINKDNRANREAMFGLTRDIKNFKTDIRNVLDTMNTKHKIQIENLKAILENSKSSRLREIARRILNNRIYH